MPYTVLERSQTQYQSNDKRFLLHGSSKDYSNQFSHLYNQRLVRLRNLLREKAVQVWGEDIKVLDKIIDSETNMDEEDTAEYIIIGTIYKEMAMRTSVLDEFKDSADVKTSNSTGNFSSPNDTLLLEDESGRIALGGVLATHVQSLVTGVCVALKGRESTLGTFQVSDWIFLNGKVIDASTAPWKDDSTAKSSYSSTNIYQSLSTAPTFLLFVSDLRVGAESTSGATEMALSRQLLVDFICGRLGGTTERLLASRIARVVVAGGSVAASTSVSTRDRFSTTKAQRGGESEFTAPTTLLDTLLAQLLGACQVDIMPGKSDPTNVSLPQQPLHPCLFRNSSRFDSLTLVPNPHEFTVDDCAVLGHSGQPVDDILRQTNDRYEETNEEPTDGRTDAAKTDGEKMVVDNQGTSSSDVGSKALAALRKTLVWGHLCPTAPDTLACHPFTEDDPFIVASSKVPRVLFAGCQESFSTCVEGGTRLLCVPSFFATQQAVLVDTRTLDYQVLEFRT